MKKYFHELTDAEFEQAVKKKKTYADFLQPDWCSYPDALSFNMGCWALTDRIIKSKDDCKDCDRCKRYLSNKERRVFRNSTE
jgi:hypothetical protein